MRDEHHRRQAARDRRRGVADVHEERTSADARAVDVGRRETELLGHQRRIPADAGHAIDVGLVDPAVRDRVPSRVEVQRQLGHVRDPSELRGLRRTDDRGPGSAAHGPAGPNTGT